MIDVAFPQCPGIYHLRNAKDGLQARFRIAGDIHASDWSFFADAAAQFADGFVDITSRAGLQIRGIKARNHWLEFINNNLPMCESSAIVSSRKGTILIDWSQANQLEISTAKTLVDVLDNSNKMLSPRFCVCIDVGSSNFSGFYSDIIFVRNGLLDDKNPVYKCLVGGKETSEEISLSDIAEYVRQTITGGLINLDTGRVYKNKSNNALENQLMVKPYWGRRKLDSGVEVLVISPFMGRINVDQIGLLRAAVESGTKLYLLPWQSIAAVTDNSTQLDKLQGQCISSGLAASSTSNSYNIVACCGSRGCAKGKFDTLEVAKQVDLSVIASNFAEPSIIHISGCERKCGWGGGENILIDEQISAQKIKSMIAI